MLECGIGGPWLKGTVASCSRDSILLGGAVWPKMRLGRCTTLGEQSRDFNGEG